MKALLLVTSLILAVAAEARVQAMDVLQFDIKSADFSTSHIRNAGPGSLTLDYKNSTVKLFVAQNHMPCPAGMMCAAVMPAPLMVELPIVSITKDSCGIKHVVASRDSRPVDGALQQITVSDPTSGMTCMTLVAVEPQATYETRYFNRMNGSEIVNKSEMTLSLIVKQDANLETSLAPAILIKLQQNTGFAPVPFTKTLYVDVTGRVISSTQNFRSDKAVVVNIATLSAEALKNLNELVSGIEVNAELVDANQGEPMCMDAPTTEVSIVVNAKDVVVNRLAGCHKFSVQDYRAERLTQLMEGLANLQK